MPFLKKVIIRIDDVCPDMNLDNFNRLKEILLSHDIKPLIGVVPDNKDDELKKARNIGSSKNDDEIWNMILQLQNEYGWDIALHGYQHMHLTDDGGIIKRNSKSEFAGIEYERQTEFIENGKDILEKKGFNLKCFMAPSHSFDLNTLRALKNNGISYITDGLGIFPYNIGENIIAFPVPITIFRNLPIGIYTVCLHPNTMREKDFSRIEKFIVQNQRCCISFSESLALLDEANFGNWKIYNSVSEAIMRVITAIIKLVYRK